MSTTSDLTVNGNLSVNGTTTLATSGQSYGLILNQSLSGAASGSLSGNYLSLNDSAVSAANGVTVFWNMAHTINAGVRGHRNSFQLATTFVGADNGATQNPYYQCFGPVMSVNAGDGGSAPGGALSWASGRGAFFVMNPVLKATSAQFLQELSVAELNVSCDANSSVAYKSMLALVPLASDAVQGTVKDDMITMSAQPGAVGFRNLINVSTAHGALPVNSGTTIMRAAGGTIATGIDFTGMTINGNAWASPGYMVTGYGNLQFSQSRAVLWDLGAGINLGVHGAQIQGTSGHLYVDNWDGGNIFLRAPVVLQSAPPASSHSAGTPGQITWDGGFVYICVAPNTWARAALSVF